MATVELTRRQQAFVTAWLANGGNGTRAAQDAGYKGSSDYLAVQASRLMRNDKVRAHIAKPLEKEKKLHERVLDALQGMALAQTNDKVTNQDKLRALDILSKAIGITKDTVNVQVNLSQMIASQEMEAEPVRWVDLPA